MHGRLFTKTSVAKKPILQEARGQWKVAHCVFTAWIKIEHPPVSRPVLTRDTMHWSSGTSMIRKDGLQRRLRKRKARNFVLIFS